MNKVINLHITKQIGYNAEQSSRIPESIELLYPDEMREPIAGDYIGIDIGSETHLFKVDTVVLNPNDIGADLFGKLYKKLPEVISDPSQRFKFQSSYKTSYDDKTL